jgi:hypothetical protein
MGSLGCRYLAQGLEEKRLVYTKETRRRPAHIAGYGRPNLPMEDPMRGSYQARRLGSPLHRSHVRRGRLERLVGC